MYTYISYTAAHSYSWLYVYCTYTQHVQKAQCSTAAVKSTQGIYKF